MKPIKERTVRSYFLISAATSFFVFFLLGAGVRSVDAVFAISMILLSTFIAGMHIVVLKGLELLKPESGLPKFKKVEKK